jgi:hypothetical protein
MDGPLSLFPLSSVCSDCVAGGICGGQRTAYACRDEHRPSDPGGPNVLHPTSKDLATWVTELGGLSFDGISAQPLELPTLPSYVPQVENLKALAGFLDGTAYAIRPAAVLRHGGRVISADEIRNRLGLSSSQVLVLLLFDQDALLEALWAARVVMGIADARFDLVVAPSYSAWTPRPRTELLVNAKRSLVFYRSLLAAGVRAVPRFVWEVERDVRRGADWILANPRVELVALDLQTYRNQPQWDHQVKGLALFDEWTGGRLSYLVNGPTTAARCGALVDVVGPRRLHLTNATTQIGLRRSRRRNLEFVRFRTRGERFIAQVEFQEALVSSSHSGGRAA